MSLSQSPDVQYPGGRFALLGVAAFLAAYALTYPLVGIDPWTALDHVVVGEYTDPVTLEDGLQSMSLTSDPVVGSRATEVEVEGWKVNGVFLYGAHFVRSEVPLPSGIETSVSPVLDAGGAYLLLMLVPPAVLMVAGFLATRHVAGPYDFQFDLGRSTVGRYAWNGALPVFFGYLPPVIVGLFLFVDVFTPNLLTGSILAGLVYPFLFGGIGGALAYVRVDEYDSPLDNAFLEQVRNAD